MIIVIFVLKSPGDKCKLIKNNSDIYGHVKDIFPSKKKIEMFPCFCTHSIFVP